MPTWYRYALHPRAPVVVLAVIVVAWTTWRLATLTNAPFEGPDMHVIIGTLEADHSAAAIASWFTGPWVQSDDYYRPLTSLVHLMDYHLWGDRPWGWRVTTTLIISLSMLAMAWAVWQAFGDRWWAVASAGLLPLINPVDRVPLWPAWRTDALCGLFLLIATGAALGRHPARWRIPVTLAALLLALVSKESAFIWPAFLAAALLVSGDHLRKWPLLLATVALTGSVWLLRVHLLGHPLLGSAPMHVNTPLEGQLWRYWAFLMGPIIWHLTATYPAYIGAPFSMLLPGFARVVLGDLAFIGANVLLIVSALRIFAIIWVWRLIMYLPSLPFVAMFDFYEYLPMLGTVMLYGIGAVEAIRRIALRLMLQEALDHA
jgi:hypothetical protein